MDNTINQSLAWARFEALRNHPPPFWDEAGVSQFHDIVAALEDVYGIDLSAFRIPNADVKPRVVQVSRAPYSGRFPARKRMSEKRYCEGHIVRRHMEGIVLFFQNLQPAPERRKIGF